MRTPFLYGEFELTIDPKNRLLVPSEIRRLINADVDGDAFFVTLRGQVPWMYPERYYEQLVSSQIQPDITPNEDVLAYAQLKFALASRVEWDNQGRIVVPEKVLKRASLGKDVTLIGMRDHLELWNRGAWDARRDELISRSADIEGKAQAAIKQTLVASKT